MQQMLSVGCFLSRRLVPVVIWGFFPSVAKSSEDCVLAPWRRRGRPACCPCRQVPVHNLPYPAHLVSCFGTIDVNVAVVLLTFLQSIWADPKVSNLISNALDNTSLVCHTVVHLREQVH